MKRIGISIAMALLAAVVFAAPALACGGNADANVDCSDIDVSDDGPAVGTVITFSGTVDITATGTNDTNYGMNGGATAGASSNAWYFVIDPEGNIITQDSVILNAFDESWWYGDAMADASQTYDWSVDILVELIGDYTAEHGGQAAAMYGHKVWVGGLCHGHWEYYIDGVDNDDCSVARTVTSHSNAAFLLTRLHPYLAIQLPAARLIERPDHDQKFFTSHGWGNPTTQDIVYTDGVWQVEIPAGTSIILDGEWHKLTWIEIDDQGGVIGRYGSDGHVTATDIVLSQPITITKVGE